MLTQIIGISASVLTATSLLPQLVKLIRKKEAEDVSLGMLAILFCGLGLWVYYGYLREDWIILLANAFSFTVNVLVMILTIRYKRKI
jgi:MtN3 and saliva related transmembrane protein